MLTIVPDPPDPRTYATVGKTIRLNTPGNARLHGSPAVVAVVEEWGARVRTPAAATGEYRAAWEEMLPLDDHSPHGAPPPLYRPAEDVCVNCQGMNMVWSGACKVCLDCGTSGGCS